ncbi:MAG: glutamate--tRNA ligase [Gemmatimonadetes bacterium]|nr:glutamate--tRNA ligase [Gemmatimonadota bacterium]
MTPSETHETPVRVRFAPSPTGFLHVGGARTALFNWLWARHTGGIFVLRIEDTDRERSTDEMIAAILDGLAWLEIDWDEGPHYQSARAGQHREAAEDLLAAGSAYPCFCTVEELAAEREAAVARKEPYVYGGRCRGIDPVTAGARRAAGEPYTVRFRVPTGETRWDDIVHGPTSFGNATIGDFIVLRTDGAPVYNLAVTVDDRDMGITHVVRGDDHISNTPKQILLYEALATAVPVFAHVPLILGPDKRKLSKRHGAVAVTTYREAGYLPQAFTNFLALLGWSPGDDREVMSRQELIDSFTLDRITGKSAVFDVQKLEWLNGQHLSRMSGAELAATAGPWFARAGLGSEAELAEKAEWFAALLDLVKERSRTLVDLVAQGRPFFPGPVEYQPEAVEKFWKDPVAAAGALGVAADFVAAERSFDDLEGMEARLRALCEERGVSAGKVMQALRVALTGARVSPGIFETMAIMGRLLVSERIETARAHLNRAPTCHSIDI